MLAPTTKAHFPRADMRSGTTLRGKAEVKPSLSDYPRSHAANYTRPVPVTSEEDALRSLKREWKRLPDTSAPSQETDLIIADLCDFEVYRCPVADQRRASELTSLHLFDIKAKSICFDGHVRLGNVKHYIERISIEDLSVEGYGQTNDLKTVVYLQTRLASQDRTHDVWLRLRDPAPNYERFHNPFLWVSVFGKLAIDYMDLQPKASVTLGDFKLKFHVWLTRRFGHKSELKPWFAAFRNASDFRVAFNAYVDYIYNQAVNLTTSRHLLSHPVWSHCKCDRTFAVQRQPNVVKMTLTTPHVFESFKHMYFASKLKQGTPSQAVSKTQSQRTRALGFVEMSPTRNTSKNNAKRDTNISSIRVGDVVSILPDEVDKTNWQKSGNEWLAYVQGIEPLRNGKQRLLVLWLYQPADTNMCFANYSIANELFLSNNCNCDERETYTTDVRRKHSIEWSPEIVDTDKEFIIRQTYVTQDSAFVTAKDDHKTCTCRKSKVKPTHWRAGDTIYITKTIDGRQLLEPVVVHEIDYERKEVKVRILLRLARDCFEMAQEANRTKIAPNELVLTSKLKTLSTSRIKRVCHIRFIPQDDVLNDRIPTPYDQRGAGDYWFISMELDSINDAQRLVFLDKLPKKFHEAQEALSPSKKLRGLSLFSGGGGLDRGLEEGGAVEFQTSVDYDPAAIHTQRANCHDPQSMRLFCGSVDDYLQALLSGTHLDQVARVGEVDLIAAGSPCPGFSALQQNMLSQQSLTYASHVTTFCTAVDVYRPLYGILENVVNMASTRKGFEEQNVLSQLVACLVSMGYQVNQYIMDSWTYGSCQRRSRIILTIAAPGFEPILQRPHTHSRSYEDTSARSLGRLPNGERFGDREHYPTPFLHVSAKEVTSDLPDIGNGNVQTCIPFPDHRLSRPTNSKTRALIECIPRQPPGCGYAQASQLGLIPTRLQSNKKEIGKAYQRIKAADLIPTITTDVNMQDARNGASVHWSQHRPLSIQDARRTQGYPDHEPIIGTLSEQWGIIGNGVDRKVSFSLGLALRDALFKSGLKPEPSEALEDDAELVVDVEDELKDHLSEASEHSMINMLREVSPPSSMSASTDSFSSTREARQRFDLSLSLDGALDVKTPSASPRLASTQRLMTEEDRSTASQGLFSRFAWKVSDKVGRLPLPAFLSFSPSTQLSLPTKRQRDNEVEEQDAVKPNTTLYNSFKRVKHEEVRRTTSPIPAKPMSGARPVARMASLPPPQRTTHTRNSGPAELGPRSWHKKIGTPTNVIKLS